MVLGEYHCPSQGGVQHITSSKPSGDHTEGQSGRSAVAAIYCALIVLDAQPTISLIG